MKIFGILLSLALAVNAGAATLVSYDFATDGSATNASGDVTGGNVTEDNLGTYVTSATLGYTTDDVLQVGPPNDSTDTLTDAVSNGSRFTITVTGNSGPYSLDDIDFNAGRGGGALERGVTVRSSLTGTTDLFRDDTVDAQRPNWTAYNVDLASNPAFDSITGDVTFSFYIYTPVAGNSLEFDDIVFSGELIPEPSAFALFGIGALGFVLRRRR